MQCTKVMPSFFRVTNTTYPTWINYFSSPDLTYNGQQGGAANLQDNKRTHMERKLAMSQLGDESASCTVATTTTTTTTTTTSTTL
jgi:hypothetical protein